MALAESRSDTGITRLRMAVLMFGSFASDGRHRGDRGTDLTDTPESGVNGRRAVRRWPATWIDRPGRRTVGPGRAHRPRTHWPPGRPRPGRVDVRCPGGAKSSSADRCTSRPRLSRVG